MPCTLQDSCFVRIYLADPRRGPPDASTHTSLKRAVDSTYPFRRALNALYPALVADNLTIDTILRYIAEIYDATYTANQQDPLVVQSHGLYPPLAALQTEFAETRMVHTKKAEAHAAQLFTGLIADITRFLAEHSIPPSTVDSSFGDSSMTLPYLKTPHALAIQSGQQKQATQPAQETATLAPFTEKSTAAYQALLEQALKTRRAKEAFVKEVADRQRGLAECMILSMVEYETAYTNTQTLVPTSQTGGDATNLRSNAQGLIHEIFQSIPVKDAFADLSHLWDEPATAINQLPSHTNTPPVDECDKALVRFYDYLKMYIATWHTEHATLGTPFGPEDVEVVRTNLQATVEMHVKFRDSRSHATNAHAIESMPEFVAKEVARINLYLRASDSKLQKYIIEDQREREAFSHTALSALAFSPVSVAQEARSPTTHSAEWTDMTRIAGQIKAIKQKLESMPEDPHKGDLPMGAGADRNGFQDRIQDVLDDTEPRLAHANKTNQDLKKRLQESRTKTIDANIKRTELVRELHTLSVELEDKENKLVNLIYKNSTMEEALHTTTNQCEDLRQKIIESERELADYSSRMKTREAEYLSLTETQEAEYLSITAGREEEVDIIVDGFVDIINQGNEWAVDLQSELDKGKQTIARLETQVAEQQHNTLASREQLVRQIQNILSRPEHIRLQQADLEMHVGEAMESEEKAHGFVSLVIQNLVQGSVDANRSFKEITDAHEAKWDAQQAAHNAEIDRVSDLMTELQEEDAKQFDELAAQNDELAAENQELATRLKEAASVGDEFFQDAIDTQCRAEIAEDKLVPLRQEINTLADESRLLAIAMTEQSQDTKRTIDSLHQITDEAEKKRAIALAEIDALHHDKDEADKKHTIALAEIAKLQRHTEEAERELQIAQTEFSAHEAQYERAIKTLEQKINKLQTSQKKNHSQNSQSKKTTTAAETRQRVAIEKLETEVLWWKNNSGEWKAEHKKLEKQAEEQKKKLLEIHESSEAILNDAESQLAASEQRHQEAMRVRHSEFAAEISAKDDIIQGLRNQLDLHTAFPGGANGGSEPPHKFGAQDGSATKDSFGAHDDTTPDHRVWAGRSIAALKALITSIGSNNRTQIGDCALLFSTESTGYIAFARTSPNSAPRAFTHLLKAQRTGLLHDYERIVKRHP